jgi:hypothetical protein
MLCHPVSSLPTASSLLVRRLPSFSLCLFFLHIALPHYRGLVSRHPLFHASPLSPLAPIQRVACLCGIGIDVGFGILSCLTSSTRCSVSLPRLLFLLLPLLPPPILESSILSSSGSPGPYPLIPRPLLHLQETTRLSPGRISSNIILRPLRCCLAFPRNATQACKPFLELLQHVAVGTSD